MRGSLTAGRFACPAGYSGLSGGYSRRARTSRGCAPFRASQGEGRRPSPYVIPTSGRRDRIGRTPMRSVINRQAAPAPGLGPWDRGGPPLSREARRVALPRLVRARSAAIAALRKATRRRRRHSVRRRCDPRTGHARPGRSRLKFFAGVFFKKAGKSGISRTGAKRAYPDRCVRWPPQRRGRRTAS